MVEGLVFFLAWVRTFGLLMLRGVAFFAVLGLAGAGEESQISLGNVSQLQVPWCPDSQPCSYPRG